MSLFPLGDFRLASGQTAKWKIECDAFDDGDWATMAFLIKRRFAFCEVHGVPRGGLKLASLLRPHVTPNCINSLIVDDVYTTGGSIRALRDKLVERPDGGGKRYLGAVVFARSRIEQADVWVSPIFQLW